MQNRIKSPVLWLSTIALIAFISKTYFGYEIPQVDELTNLLLAVLIALGIVNNPTDSEGI